MKPKKVFFIIIIILLLAAASYYFVVMRKSPGAFDKIFALNKKELGTKIYYSDNLGIGFTYMSNELYNPKITESGNKITIGDQEVEVFTKDPKASLQKAIENNFLKGYKPADCFVKNYQASASEQKLPNYISATISFPTPNNSSDPWWKNSDKCPQYYSETNGVQYFLMNSKVPGKFLFVRLGQGGAVSDGTPLTSEGGHNWSYSIRIVK